MRFPHFAYRSILFYAIAFMAAGLPYVTVSGAVSSEPRPLVEWNPALNFRYTCGITDPANHQYSERIKNWCDWSGWVNGKWTKDTEFLTNAGIEMPDFSLLTHDQQDIPLAFMLPPGQGRQSTHNIEHTVYAIPGHPVVLYPYYEMERQARENYCIRYAHWYDWLSGDTPSTTVGGKEQDVLDFRVDPIGIYKSDNNGYFGLPGLNGYDYHIKTAQEWKSFANYLNANDATPDRLMVRVLIDADLDFAGIDEVPQLANNNKPFRGLIDGAGHTIKNFHCDIIEGGGFIKLVSGGCEIRNLNFDSSCKITGNKKCAGVIGTINGASTEDVIISNVCTYAEVTSTDKSAWAMGGLIGYFDGYKGTLKVSDCRISGKVMSVGFTPGDKNNFTGIGCLAGSPKAEFTNLLIDAEVPQPTGDNNPQAYGYWSSMAGITQTNCYGPSYDRTFQKYKDTEEGNLEALGPTFEMQNGKVVPKTVILHHDPVEVPRTACYATTPVFLYPENADKLKGSSDKSLPEEYVIAADFSQSFTVRNNMTKSGDKYTAMAEPVIHFRHIFHIKDGCELARRLSADEAANADYIKSNTRFISARKGKDFQVRLSNPYPTKLGTESGLFYVAADNTYKPTGGVTLRISDRDGNPVVNEYTTATGTKSAFFTLDSKVKAYGPVVNNGVEYVKAGDEYARMLCFNDPLGLLKNIDRFVVEVIALDVDGKQVNIKGSSSPLVVEKFEIDMLGESKASFVTAADFYSETNDAKYAEYRPEALEKAPNTHMHDQINFDEYRAFISPDAPKSSAIDGSDYVMGSGDKFWYKWPMTLSQGDYAFGYDRAAAEKVEDRYEYNEYIIATHSSIVPWKSGVEGVDDGVLYDRYWYESKRRNRDQQPGFFYYVNAASDPGNICYLRAKDICMGSTVRVSAWVAEFSPYKSTTFEEREEMTETANVAFTFQAVKGNGERVNIHTFVTGYVAENYGKWMHVYYEFTPRTADFNLEAQDIDHYELRLANNCRNSNGADYAIDDITVYIQNPTVIARQQSQICKPSDSNFEVRVGAPFESLLQVLFEKAGTGKEMQVYYTFIDKQLFDQKYELYSHDRSIVDPGERAWKESVVKYDYDSDGNKDAVYGTLKFNTTFENNNPYSPEAHYTDLACKYTEDGVDYIVFNTFPKDDRLRAEKEYYISMIVKQNVSNFEPEWMDFNITLPCTLHSTFTVTPTSIIKIEGDILDDDSRTEYCENMQPTVQVNLKGYDPDTGEIIVVDQNAVFDWFDGTLDEYYDASKDGILLSDALFHFHAAYPDLDDVDLTLVPRAGLTEDMIKYLYELSHPSDANEHRKLILSRRSYTFPPMKIPEAYDENGNRIDHGTVYALAIPIEHITEGELVSYRICTIPTQVALVVREKSPYIAHGFKDITYPSRITDAPLRASLKQLREASAAPTSNFASHPVKLNVPLRTVIFSGVTEATDMRRPAAADGSMCAPLALIWTDDPQYSDLGTTNDTNPELSSSNGLLTAGEVTGIKATGSEGTYDAFECVFDNSFVFKEGFSYQFKFPFEEDNDLRNERCPGQEIFTLRVVPEYLMWSPAFNANLDKYNLNFNNDANWRRVESAETFSTLSDSNSPFFSNGSNKTPKAFAPLDFSKVIIPSEPVAPHLFSISERAVAGVQHCVNNSALWSESPSSRDANEVMTGYAYTFDPDEATYDVEYDLACFLDGNIWCRPWYANTCEQIHFLPDTRIVGQKWLRYGKAWVDLKLTPFYWHMIASPLKEAYAGDFYLPTDGACQKSPLFQDITFSEALNNRFAPAVYQRGYRLGSATVYKIDNSTVNVAYDAGWSNVFNDVQALYGSAGDIGFSIKVDPSDAINRGDGDDVIFRLPKNDSTYTYYDRNNLATNPLTSSVKRTAAQYRLNEAEDTIQSRVKASSRFILVGNPLMSDLDMATFLKANKDIIQPKFWIVSGTSQLEGMFDTYTPGDPHGSASGTVPPMSAFFVQLKDGVSLPVCDDDSDTALLTLHYDSSMATLASAVEPSERNDIKISAICDGVEVSAATIVLNKGKMGSDIADNSDMLLLDNTRSLGLPAVVYAITDNKAVSIARRNGIEGTELGVISPDPDATVTLRFAGIAGSDDLLLYNSYDDSFTPIYDGMEMEVKDARSGLFIVKRGDVSDQLPAASILWHCSNGNLTVTATTADAPLDVTVSDLEGRIIATCSALGQATIPLTPGIYIINATDPRSKLSVKVRS